MSEEVKRWTSKRKASLVIQIVKGQTTLSEASREFDLPPPQKFSRGLMRHTVAWRMPYAQNPRIFVSNTKVKSRD